MARFSFILQVCLVCLVLAVAVPAAAGRRGRKNKPNKPKGCKGSMGKFNPNCISKRRNTRSVVEDPKEITAEELFSQLDTNEDKLIDGCEWVMAPYTSNSIREFVKLLDEADIDGDERLSLPEFQARRFNPATTSKYFRSISAHLGKLSPLADTIENHDGGEIEQ